MALSFAGVGYLIWAVVAGVSRSTVQELIKSADVGKFQLHDSAYTLKIIFVEAGIVIDLVGLAWLAATLFLVLWASRQRSSISWAWCSAMGQVIIAALGAVLVGWAAYQPYVMPPNTPVPPEGWTRVSAISLPVVVVISVVLWVAVLVWLLVNRGRINRRGPTPRDGLRTNFYR